MQRWRHTLQTQIHTQTEREREKERDTYRETVHGRRTTQLDSAVGLLTREIDSRYLH